MRLFDGLTDGPGLTKANADAIQRAEDYAAEGGQGLHVWDPGPNGWPGAPNVFQRNRPWAHLFDRDEERLIKTAKRLGVRVVVVGRRGRRGQHIDLCGKPLERAMAESEPDPGPQLTLL